MTLAQYLQIIFEETGALPPDWCIWWPQVGQMFPHVVKRTPPFIIIPSYNRKNVYRLNDYLYLTYIDCDPERPPPRE